MHPRSFFVAALTSSLLCACGARLVVGQPHESETGSESTPPPLGSSSDGATATEARWEWVSPRPAGHTLRGIWGTSASGIWLVGEHGTVLHYDGTKVDAPFAGADTDVFYTVWSSGPSDVWIAGDGGGRGSRVAHYDGRGWSTSYSLGSYRVHSIWGAAPSEVYAAIDDGETGGVLRWYGSVWSRLVVDERSGTGSGAPPPGRFLRDVWGAGDENRDVCNAPKYATALYPKRALCTLEPARPSRVALHRIGAQIRRHSVPRDRGRELELATCNSLYRS